MDSTHHKRGLMTAGLRKTHHEDTDIPAEEQINNK
jgi:hypothetical protein